MQGKYFQCIEHVYKNSAAKIKLLNKISEKIYIACSREQGHPLSPELFKCFIHHLSEDLNNLNSIKVPRLNIISTVLRKNQVSDNLVKIELYILP